MKLDKLVEASDGWSIYNSLKSACNLYWKIFVKVKRFTMLSYRDITLYLCAGSVIFGTISANYIGTSKIIFGAN